MIAGIDEAGRGALAGPVVVACVMFIEDSRENNTYIDSKKLSKKKRQFLFNKLTDSNAIIKWSLINHKIIDKINILNATLKAMSNCIKKLPIVPNKIIIDGNKTPIIENMHIEACINGDNLINEISAASIIAKVIRDTIMTKYQYYFPNFNFKKHKGYATKEHYLELSKYGPCKIHRKTFNLNFQLPLF